MRGLREHVETADVLVDAHLSRRLEMAYGSVAELGAKRRDVSRQRRVRVARESLQPSSKGPCAGNGSERRIRLGRLRRLSGGEGLASSVEEAACESEDVVDVAIGAPRAGEVRRHETEKRGLRRNRAWLGSRGFEPDSRFQRLGAPPLTPLPNDESGSVRHEAIGSYGEVSNGEGRTPGAGRNRLNNGSSAARHKDWSGASGLAAPRRWSQLPPPPRGNQRTFAAAPWFARSSSFGTR